MAHRSASPARPGDCRSERHARKYRLVRNQAAVLDKYADRGRALQRDEAMRQICHVCAWVSLLPLELAVGVAGCSGLSPVRVLVLLLQRQSEGALTIRFQEALVAVRTRVSEARASTFPSSGRRDWEKLRHVLQRKAYESGGETQKLAMPAPPAAQATAQTPPQPSQQSRQPGQLLDVVVELEQRSQSATTLRQCRELQKRLLVRVEALCGEERDAEIRGVLERSAEALESGDADAMVMMLGEVVALMVPPRRCSGFAAKPRESFVGQVDVRCCAALQQKLCAVFLRLVGVRGGGGLDLQDHGTRRLLKVPLMRVRSLVASFDSNAGDAQQAPANHQWQLVTAAITLPKLSSTYQEVTATLQSRRARKHEFSRITDTNAYEPSKRTQALANVVHRPDMPRVLRCMHCDIKITSSWYFVRCRSRAESVLVPRHGCRQCRRHFGRIVPLKVFDGFPQMNDVFVVLDMCEHATQRNYCKRGCGHAAYITWKVYVFDLALLLHIRGLEDHQL